MVSHVITFMDDVAMRIPSLDAWNQFVWLPEAATMGRHGGGAVQLSLRSRRRPRPRNASDPVQGHG